MITQNFDIESGIVNGCAGTLVSIRYTVDDTGRRHAESCIIYTPSSSDRSLPHLERFQSVVLADTVEFMLRHPFDHSSLKVKRTQICLQPGFAMTVHKSQGLSTRTAVVDLEGCRGTEAPYVILSRVKSLEGLIIMQPFRINCITCRQSEDLRHEMRRLEILNLLTIINTTSNGTERAQAELDLSAQTGGPCSAMTVSAETITTCSQGASETQATLEAIEKNVTSHCMSTKGQSQTLNCAMDQPPLKRRVGVEPKTALRQKRRQLRMCP